MPVVEAVVLVGFQGSKSIYQITMSSPDEWRNELRGLRLYSENPCPIMPGDRIWYGAGSAYWTQMKNNLKVGKEDVEFNRFGYDFTVWSKRGG